ncbi:MAG: sulfur transferase domain-containing protein [Xanthobacteraceae bacterium]
MRRSQPVILLCLGVACLFTPAIGALTRPAPALAQAAVREAPFGDRAGPLAVNYTRLKPHVATAGLLRDGAIPVLKALGFATIVDLRSPAEGAGAEQQAAAAAGLRYVNIPVTGGVPTDAQVAEFARIVEDPNNAPLLVHCASANRVGAMWTLYRVRQGIPLAIALEEGRTAGLRPDREAELRKRL